MIDLLSVFVFVHSRYLNCFPEFSIFLNKISNSSSVLFIKLFIFKEHSGISLCKDSSLCSGFMQDIHRQVPQSSGFGFNIFEGTYLVNCAYEISSFSSARNFSRKTFKDDNRYRNPFLVFFTSGTTREFWSKDKNSLTFFLLSVCLYFCLFPALSSLMTVLAVDEILLFTFH